MITPLKQVTNKKAIRRRSMPEKLRCFVFAWNGIQFFVRAERNARTHLLFTAMAITGGFAFSLTKLEWVAIIFAIASVWVAEMFNTTIEKTIDFVSTDYHPRIKEIKDVSAGAVLIASLAAIAIALLIFIPKLFDK